MTDLFSQFITWLVHFTETLGYPGIFILTMLESTFMPIPSEVTLLPAGYLIHTGAMNAWVVFVVATAGMLTGSLINYYIAFFLGRGFLVRYGHYFWFPVEKLEGVEKFFLKHGAMSTFIGRLIIGVRHFIAFPAGLAKMDLKQFCFYTLLGGMLWIAILLVVGYLIGDNKEWIAQYFPTIKFAVVGIALAGIGFYVYRHRKQGNSHDSAA